MSERVKIITQAISRSAGHNTKMWFVRLDNELSAQWDDGPYWQGWIESEIAHALGVDWLGAREAGHRFKVCRMTETLFAASLTRPIAGGENHDH